MYKTGLFAEQNLFVDTPPCTDCQRSHSVRCAHCGQFVCNKHQRKIQGYFPPERVTVCEECEQALAYYNREVVNPLYPVA
jgi:arginyl-tRNA--protein-N-Asp/Glu arginylyltransferase